MLRQTADPGLRPLCNKAENVHGQSHALRNAGELGNGREKGHRGEPGPMWPLSSTHETPGAPLTRELWISHRSLPSCGTNRQKVTFIFPFKASRCGAVQATPTLHVLQAVQGRRYRSWPKGHTGAICHAGHLGAASFAHYVSNFISYLPHSTCSLSSGNTGPELLPQGPGPPVSPSQ